MEKGLLATAITLLILTTSVSANMDTECSLLGDYVGVVQWVYDNDSFKTAQERFFMGCEGMLFGPTMWGVSPGPEPPLPGNTAIMGGGGCEGAEIIAREGPGYYPESFPKIGEPKGVAWDDRIDMSPYYYQVTVCKQVSNNGGGSTDGDGAHGVPEFTSLTLAVAVVIVGLGFTYLRKNS